MLTRSLLLALAVLGLLSSAALAGGEVYNEDGGYNGIYRATVKNRTQGTITENVEVEIEDKYVTVRFPAGSVQMRIDQIYDRKFQLEVTGRHRETGDLYIIQIAT